MARAAAKVIPLPHAAVAERSGYQCGFTHAEHGRCARSAAQDDHHVVRKGEGGSDDPENRVLVCPHHHAQVHGQVTPFMARLWHRRAKIYLYAENDDGSGDLDRLKKLWAGVSDTASVREAQEAMAAHGATAWSLWPDVEAEWEARAAALDARLAEHRNAEHSHAWDLAGIAYGLLRGNLWSLLGYDSLRDYAEERGYKESTFKSYARAERRLRSVLSPPNYSRGRALPIGVWIQRGGQMAKMTEEQVLSLADLADKNMPTGVLLDAIEEGADAELSEEHGPRWEVEVCAQDVKFVIRPRGKDEAEAKANAERSLANYSSLASAKITRVRVLRRIGEQDE